MKERNGSTWQKVREMKSVRVFAWVLLVALLGGAFWHYIEKKETGEAKSRQTPVYTVSDYIQDHVPKTGTKAPDFTLPKWGGGEAGLGQSKGKPVVINFWATYCDYCQEEMAAFQRVYAQMGDQVNFYMIDAAYTEHEAAIGRFVKRNHITLPVLLDQSGDVGNSYFAKAFPQTFILDREHRIFYHHSGPMTEELLREQLQKVLKKGK
ncbi:TlpA disulfide reductase family protein [Thermoactinomyces sp. CICC 10521]|jgi:peroxiredoxin|uniref:TlpA family protein disulfide reductase n=2 Tax=unclassified Thermoactinomyces TaxID=2634588 RepID=UPI0018DB3F1E|nr:TlpA disulfide reductase family protein [Thermoactinomyces sp. CICC 10521]MBH8606482.1 TlpA family protein disulfide reductase [Thermoactinomyces sp. CICC 10521]